MQNRKAEIEARLEAVREDNFRRIAALTDRVSIEEYRSFVRTGIEGNVWTDALQKALEEHEVVLLPASAQPYFIDRSIIIPSNRRIEAQSGAVVRILSGVKVLMLRNEHTLDGTHMPIAHEGADNNISISGGRWEEYHRSRAGYGVSGLYDEARSMHGVSTCMFFNHMDHLTLTDMTFAHCAGFAVQIGNVRNAVFENITFDSCYADGLHINGFSENVLARNIRGEVGDDLVALNAYDWQNSAVNFGPITSVLCENLHSAPTSPYKSLRLLPGIYTFRDGSQVDCALRDVIIRGVRGIHTFKLYFQTPVYSIGTDPEPGREGNAGHIYFEDIDIDLTGPVDELNAYMESDPVRGAFASFELGANIDLISLKDIRLTLHRDRFPLSCLLIAGPKSVRIGDMEVFDPYISNHVRSIELENITVNGIPMTETGDLVRTTSFDDVNGDGRSTACGTIGEITIQ